jgi:hypothetical protein
MATTRREALLASVAAPLALGAEAAGHAAGKTYRIGVISAANRGKPQLTNGHTWHFAQYLHPEINLDAVKKYLDPGSADFFRKYVRNPKFTFDRLPFPRSRPRSWRNRSMPCGSGMRPGSARTTST